MQTGKAPAALAALHRKSSPAHRSSPRPGAVMPPAAAASSRRAARGTLPRSAAPCWRRSSAARLSARPPARRKPRPRRIGSAATGTGSTARAPRSHRPQHPSPLPLPAAARRPQPLTRPARSRSRSAELPSLPPMPCSPCTRGTARPAAHAGHAAGTKRRPLRHRLRLPRQSTPPTRSRPLRRSPKSQRLAFLRRGGGCPERRIRADHIWLSNPVLVRGLGMAPVIGAALDGRRALMLCIASLILVTFTRVLAVAICHLTKNRFRPVVYCYSCGASLHPYVCFALRTVRL